MKQKSELESLTEIASSDEQVDGIKVTDDILTFMVKFNIKDGKFRIKRDVLYSLYKSWSKKPKSKYSFSKYVNRLIADGDSRNYFINLSSLKLHQDLFEYLNSKERPTEKVRNYKNHFDAFLKHYGFEKGDFFIRESSFYYLYDKWVYANKSKLALKEATILNFCNMYFDSKTLKDGIYLGINKDNMTATLEELEFATKWNNIRNEKKESKKLNKVRSTKT